MRYFQKNKVGEPLPWIRHWKRLLLLWAIQLMNIVSSSYNKKIARHLHGMTVISDQIVLDALA